MSAFPTSQDEGSEGSLGGNEMEGSLHIQTSSTPSPMCSLGTGRPCCGHSVAHLLHAAIQSQLGCCSGRPEWHCATHTAHCGEPMRPALHRPGRPEIPVWQEDKSLEMNPQPKHSWTLAVAPAGAILPSLSFSCLFWKVHHARAHSSDRRV